MSGQSVQPATFFKVFGEMMVMVGFTKLKKPNAVNPTHSLTSIKIATTRIYGGHLIIKD